MSVQYTPNGNVISILIPVFESYLNRCKKRESILIILKALASITELQREALYKTIFTSQTIVNRMLELMDSGNFIEHKYVAGRVIFGILHSNNIEYAEELVHRGLFNTILQHVRSCQEQNRKLVDLIMLKIISNIVASSFEAIQTLMGHPVFGEFVLCCTHPHSNHTKVSVR